MPTMSILLPFNVVKSSRALKWPRTMSSDGCCSEYGGVYVGSNSCRITLVRDGDVAAGVSGGPGSVEVVQYLDGCGVGAVTVADVAVRGWCLADGSNVRRSRRVGYR